MFCLSNLIKESNRKTVISSFFYFTAITRKSIYHLLYPPAQSHVMKCAAYFVMAKFTSQILIRKEGKGKENSSLRKEQLYPVPLNFCRGKNRTRVRDVS